MNPIRHVLVATDFHPPSLHAIDYAAHLARGAGARVTLLHALDTAAHDEEGTVSTAPDRLLAERTLAGLGDILRAEGIEVDEVLRDGEAEAEILEAGRALDADLLVLGSSGRRGAQRMLVGSVAESVARRAALPVTIVHEWSFADRADAADRLARRVSIHKGEIDLTIAITRGAVPLAVEIGRALDTRVETYLVEPVRDEDQTPVGAVGEDGAVLVPDTEPPPGESIDRALATVTRDAEWLGRAALGELAGYRVLLVADAAPTRALPRLAAREVRAGGASHVSFAVPVCSARTIATLAPDVDRTICLEVTHVLPHDARAYRDAELPPRSQSAQSLILADLRAARHASGAAH